MMTRSLHLFLGCALVLVGCDSSHTGYVWDALSPDAGTDTIMTGDSNHHDPGVPPSDEGPFVDIVPVPDDGLMVDGGFVDIVWPDPGGSPDVWIIDVAGTDYGPTPDSWSWEGWTWDGGSWTETWTGDGWTWDYGPLPDVWLEDGWSWDYVPMPDVWAGDGWSWDYGPMPDAWTWDGWSWDYGPMPDAWTWDGWSWDYGPMPDSWDLDWVDYDWGAMPDVDDQCGAITDVGCCDGDVNKWCSGGYLVIDDCADWGEQCGWISGFGFYGCGGSGQAPGNDPPVECP